MRAGRKMNVSCFFCSSLIKANDGLSRSLYAYHRQTAGCNELLSGTWQISRKQAAVLVSAVLIGEGFFFFFKRNSVQHKTEREKAAQCPCPCSRRYLENVAFSPWFDLSRGKKKLIFSLPKLKLLKNTRQSEELAERSALLFTCTQTTRVLGLEPCVFVAHFREHCLFMQPNLLS